MSRRPVIKFLAVALVLIALLNGAWFYSYQEDPPLGSTLSGSGLPQTPSAPGRGSGNTDSSDKIEWSRFAYVQYVTATEHVCNSVMVFESLHRLDSKADRMLLYPKDWGAVDGPTWKALGSQATTILGMARDEYHVKLRPVDLIRQQGQDRTYKLQILTTELIVAPSSHSDLGSWIHKIPCFQSD